MDDFMFLITAIAGNRNASDILHIHVIGFMMVYIFLQLAIMNIEQSITFKWAVFFQDFGGEIRFFGRDFGGVKGNRVTGAQTFGIFYEGLPADAVNRVVERDFNLSFAAFAVKPRRNDLGVVENENVAFVQDFGQSIIAISRK